jgi:hypothetical protein
MMMKKKRYYSEDMGSEMIKSDHSAPANMPKEVIMKDYPKYSYYNSSELQDNLKGINEQMNADVSKANKERSDSKY